MASAIRRIGIPILLCLTTEFVAAQPSPGQIQSAGSAPPLVTAAKTPAQARLGYESAFEGYRPFGDQRLAPWRESNDVVRRVGGWQAYAREAQGEAPAGDGTAGAASAGHSGMHMRSAPGPTAGTASASPSPSRPSVKPETVPAGRQAPPPNTGSGSHSGHKTP